MRILKENVPKVSKQEADAYIRADKDQKEKLLNQLLDKWGKPALKNIFDAIMLSTNYAGINPEVNHFLQLCDDLEFTPNSSHLNKFKKLVPLYNRKSMDLTKDFFKEEALYNVPDDEFEYVVKLFNSVSNPATLSKYFKDTKDISIDALYVNNNKSSGKIKPMGKEGDSTDTLIGTVESWSGENGENDIPIVNSKQIYAKSKALPNSGPSIKELEDIYSNMKNVDLNHINNDENKKEGNIVFINKKGNTVVNSFYKFEDGEWKPFETINTHAVKYHNGLLK